MLPVTLLLPPVVEPLPAGPTGEARAAPPRWRRGSAVGQRGTDREGLGLPQRPEDGRSGLRGDGPDVGQAGVLLPVELLRHLLVLGHRRVDVGVGPGDDAHVREGPSGSADPTARCP